MNPTLYLIAHLAGRGVAIDTACVESVVDIGAVTPVPRASPAVRGLAALRSRVVTVIDTRIALGLPPATNPVCRAVITLVDGHHYAILVDSLEDVAPFAAVPLPAELSRQSPWRGVARGIVERDGEPLLVIDLVSLVPGLSLAA
jgi:purine-binding chemotaxis protein CheW